MFLVIVATDILLSSLTSVLPESDTVHPCQVNTAILEPGPKVYFLFRFSSDPNTSAIPENSSSWTRSPASTSKRSSVSFSRSNRVPEVPALPDELRPSSADFSGASAVMAVIEKELGCSMFASYFTILKHEKVTYDCAIPV